MPGCFSFLIKQRQAASSQVNTTPNHMATQQYPDPKNHAGCACSFPAGNPGDWIQNASLPKYEADYNKLDSLHTLEKNVDKLSPSLRKISLQMHDTPELAWVEYKTSKLLSEYIESYGFHVNRNAYGTETGFEAIFEHGQGGRTIGVCPNWAGEGLKLMPNSSIPRWMLCQK